MTFELSESIPLKLDTVTVIGIASAVLGGYEIAPPLLTVTPRSTTVAPAPRTVVLTIGPIKALVVLERMS